MSGPEAVKPEGRQWVRLTRVCNQRCLFCLDRFAQDGGYVALDSIRRSLASGRRQGLTRVVLSGGEPTLHPEYLGVIGLARQLGYTHIQTITNGRRFCYEKFLDDAVDAGLAEVTFSMHGHTAELHDRLTNVKGAFVQALTGLRNALLTPDLIVSVDVVINRLNLPVLRELLEFYIGLGVGEFDLLALVPFGDAWKNRDGLFCDLAEPENRRHLHRALELSRRPELHIWTNRLRADLLEGFENLIQPPEKILDELRGRKMGFARLLKSGKPMGCKGESCELCFLRNFCADLETALGGGSVAARPRPRCLAVEPESAPFRFNGKRDIIEFAKFYIESRYFAKGSFCRACPHAAGCEGMSVGELRVKGGVRG